MNGMITLLEQWGKYDVSSQDRMIVFVTSDLGCKGVA